MYFNEIRNYADMLLPALLQNDAVYKTTFTIANGSCYILSNNKEIQKFLSTHIEMGDVTFLKGKMNLELYNTEKEI